MSAVQFPLTQHPLQREYHDELVRIADWWATHAVDSVWGGFVGEITNDNRVLENATKGVILNARILWFFSETARYLDNPAYRACAQRAFDYLTTYFADAEQGGFYWELNAQGEPINTKKQVYAQAFVIYALCAFYQLSANEVALNLARNTFELIERKAIDHTHQGYLEAFTRDWNVIEDLRLSEKDLNYPKSQNTHLHVLEAYTRLAQVDPSDTVRAALRYSIDMFDKYMINRDNYHLRMFMDMQWRDFSPGFTYGHDIEAAWLIGDALEVLGDAEYLQRLTPDLIQIAKTCAAEGVGAQGQVLDAFNFASNSVNADTVWWVQAEAMVGFLYAHSITQDAQYLRLSEALWEFIKRYQIDAQHGEWLWFSRLDAPSAAPAYKLGFWKCPYHNGRAMIEAAKYLQRATGSF